MLSRGDLLHFWPAADPNVRLAGGDPVFERDGAVIARGEGLKLRSLIRLSPRFEKVQLVDGGWRSAMLLERAGANLITSPSDFASWNNTNCTVTSGQADPFGGVTASLLNATVAGGHRAVACAYTSSGTRGFSIVVKRPSHLAHAAFFHFGIYDNTAAVFRNLVRCTWGARRPVLTTDSGSGERWTPIELGNDWWELRANADGVVHTNTNVLYIYPGGTGSTGNLYVARAQGENSIAPTSIIPGPDGVSNLRTLEKFYWKNGPAPQNTLVYERFIYGGESSLVWRWLLGSSAYAPPFIGMYQDVSEGLNIYYNNDGGGASQSINSVKPVDVLPGDLIDSAVLFKDNGEFRIIWRVNEYSLAVNGGGGFAALPANWGPLNRLWINGWDATEVGSSQYLGLMIVKPDNMLHNAYSAAAERVINEVHRFYFSLPKAA